MLGEKIWEASGEVIGRRVLAGDGAGPKAETTFGGSGYLLGVEGTTVATYWEVVRPDGTLYGEGQGIFTAKDGSTVSWTANGVSKISSEGVSNSRGAVFFQTTSPQFARLNGLCGITEHETDAEGKSNAVVWEWK
jgi:hypothetical protein